MGAFPNPGAYLAVSEEDFNSLRDDVPLREQLESIKRLLFTSASIYQCQECGELVVIWKGRDRTDAEFYKKN